MQRAIAASRAARCTASAGGGPSIQPGVCVTAKSDGVASGAAIGVTQVAVKVEPAPGWLSTCTSPPIRRASVREMSSPSPLPPQRRVIEGCACGNR